MTAYSPFFKIEIYCPQENIDEILAALANAHAGEIGQYDHCSTVSEVQGSYRPLEGANPAIGEVGKVSESAGFLINDFSVYGAAAVVISTMLE
jgi:hypothetical protein